MHMGAQEWADQGTPAFPRPHQRPQTAVQEQEGSETEEAASSADELGGPGASWSPVGRQLSGSSVVCRICEEQVRSPIVLNPSDSFL